MNNKPIVIIGGMGPQASAQLYKMIISKASRHPAAQVDIFPHIILRSISVPDFIADQSNLLIAKSILTETAKHIVNDKPCVSVMACNTAHLLAQDISTDVRTAFVSMIDTVAASCADRRFHRVGVLASPTTLQTGLYTDALHTTGIAAVIPNLRDQARTEACIRRVLRGTTRKSDGATLLKIANNLMERGSEAIILGCTELPLIFPVKDSAAPIISSLDEIANVAVEKYYAQ